MPHSFPTRRSSDLDASHCGAEVDLPALPGDPALDGLDAGLRQQAALAGGDVYQLCFTVPPARREEIARLAARTSTRATRIGRIVADPGLVARDADGGLTPCRPGGFDHFS